ncbi:MAG: hypothetical protein ACI89T_001845, partial [Cognaticolwellia sp.]
LRAKVLSIISVVNEYELLCKNDNFISSKLPFLTQKLMSAFG